MCPLTFLTSGLQLLAAAPNLRSLEVTATSPASGCNSSLLETLKLQSLLIMWVPAVLCNTAWWC